MGVTMNWAEACRKTDVLAKNLQKPSHLNETPEGTHATRLLYGRIPRRVNNGFSRSANVSSQLFETEALTPDSHD
jgi:hypothetical protein